MILRLFNVQIIQHSFYEAFASDQHDLIKKLYPNRGEIYAQDPYSDGGIYALAINRDYNTVYANPTKIKDAKVDTAWAAEQIAPILDVSAEEILPRLTKENDSYEPLKNKVTDLEVEAIKALNIAGIGYKLDSWRYYPEGEATAQLTGFLGYVDEAKKGRYGLEGYWEEELAGTAGYLKSEKDAGGRFIAIGDSYLQAAEDGKSIILTIDKNVQYYACEKLKEAVEAHGAKKGSVIIVKPQSGAILAICNYPSFDANNYAQVENLDVYINSAISEEYEPGSVFKTFTLSAAIDAGKITPETTYEDKGSVLVDGYPEPIENSDTLTKGAHGVVDMNTVLALSLNTGSIFAAQQLGNEAFYNYIKKWGFGEKTGIELSSEQTGSLTNLEKLKDIYTATGSYGQGLLVTPLQLVMAYNSIANGGKLLKPYLIEKIIYPSGYIEEREPEVVRQVISEQTARTMSAMLVNVVDNGHSKAAALSGYFIGGKTGTAQVPKENGKGYDAYRHKDTFVGYGPITDPQFVMLTKLDEPQDSDWAESSVVPLFKEIEDFLINYYKIPPDREQ